MDFLLHPPAPIPQSYLSLPNYVNSRNHKLPCDGGNVVFYHKHNVQGLSAAIVHYHTRVLSHKFTVSEYSKISIQLSSWAKISFFDLKLLLNSAATLEVRTKDQSLSNCTSQQVTDNMRGHVNGGLS